MPAEVCQGTIMQVTVLTASGRCPAACGNQVPANENTHACRGVQGHNPASYRADCLLKAEDIADPCQAGLSLFNPWLAQSWARVAC